MSRSQARPEPPCPGFQTGLATSLIDWRLFTVPRALMIMAALGSIVAGCSTDGQKAFAPAAAANGCATLPDPVRSTFVLQEMGSGRVLGCNMERAKTRFTPASTFKIPHALIALETGVVQDENAAFVWDGRPRGVKAWDKNTSLAGAIAGSTVWVFQQVAARIGLQREQTWLARLSYGNAQAGGADQIRRFWLISPLAISAVEQVEFLDALRRGKLRAAPSNQFRVRAMLKVRDCGPGCVVYGKTGAVLPIDDQGHLRSDGTVAIDGERTGWFVGWVDRPEAAGGPVVFAFNLDLSLPNAMAARTEAAYTLLAANGVIPSAR